jgi:membrane-bound lytic murein transglycosylase D
MSGSFPVPHQIDDNVAFWRNVYGTWSRGQAVLHDDQHLGIVYEVVELSDPLAAGNSNEQRELLNARQAELGQRLAVLEAKVAAGDSLNAEERELRDKIVSVAGPQAVFGAHERLRSQRGMRERFRRGLEISGRYDEAFREIFRSQGLPEDLAYLPHVESSFQTNARSNVGAAGVWQFMPSTGRLYMKVGNHVDERLDPVSAAEGAARYLGNAHSRLESWPLAITSYNHGVGGMQRAKSEFGDDFGRIAREYKGPAFGFASRNFYAEFLAAREVASNPSKYFPEGVKFEQPPSAKRVVLDQSLPAHQIARQHDVDVGTLNELNLAWLAPVRSGRAAVPAGTAVWVPKGPGPAQRPFTQPQPEPVLLAMDEGPPTFSTKVASAKVDRIPEPAKVKSAAVAIATADEWPTSSNSGAKATQAKIEEPNAPKTSKTSALAKVEPATVNVKAEKPVALAKAEVPTPASKDGKAPTAAKIDEPALSAKGNKTPTLAKAEPPATSTKGAKPTTLAQPEPSSRSSKTGKPEVLAKAEPSTGPAKGRGATLPREEPAVSAGKGAKTQPVAKTEPATPANKGGKPAAEAKVKVHVVKPNETLYRVADLYDLSVDDLKRINGISSKETTLRPGQKLRVSI